MVVIFVFASEEASNLQQSSLQEYVDAFFQNPHYLLLLLLIMLLLLRLLRLLLFRRRLLLLSSSLRMIGTMC